LARERLAGNPQFVWKLERLGRERALIYKTLLLTGLRKREIASLTIGQLELDCPMPFVILHAADEKNRQGSTIPLRHDLVNDLRGWLSDTQNAAMARLGSKRPLFTVPEGLVRILDRDLKAAGINKCDERGRTLDVHALRYSFGTLLSKAGVAPRTAQAAMRHSKIELTMCTYTDPKLLDVAGALDSLPSLNLDASPSTVGNSMHARGSEDGMSLAPVPSLVRNPGDGGQIRSTAVISPVNGDPGASGRGSVRSSVRQSKNALPAERASKALSSGDDGDRTRNLRLAKPALSQLSYVPGTGPRQNQ